MITDLTKFIKIFEAGFNASKTSISEGATIVLEAEDKAQDPLLLIYTTEDTSFYDNDSQFEYLNNLSSDEYKAYESFLETNGILLEYNNNANCYTVSNIFMDLKSLEITENVFYNLFEGNYSFDSDTNEYHFLNKLDITKYNELVSKLAESNSELSFEEVNNEYILKKK